MPGPGPASASEVPHSALPSPMTLSADRAKSADRSLFAAFVVGGVLGKAVPLWVVVVVGLAVGFAVFVFVDRYPRLPGRGWTRRA